MPADGDVFGFIYYVITDNIFLYLGLGLTPFATGGLSPRLGRDSAVALHIDYIMEDDQLFLDIQVDQI